MSDAAIVIRAADNADIDALAGIGLASFRETYADYSSATDMAAHLDAHFTPAAITREMARPDRSYLVAAIDGWPAGLAKLRQGDCPDAIPERNSVELQQLYVLPGNQRFGIGGRLLDAVVDIAQQRKARGIWLSVWESADWAVSFYRKAGFAQVGTTKFRMGEMLHTDFLMWRSVEPD